MEFAVIRLLVVFSGVVLVALASTPFRKETPETTFRAEKSQWMMEARLDNYFD
ncbi:Bgt-55043 [Blumeria graminis f. sp. tritici]|uniref:Bgt-55043 n=1 Tax=Blumeria graminis f. sp. tritici TaxID=62690 RepID=A0A9X9MK92_BLUGR|nr:Bgt-55043 [Blumeria graminis f. sp. tritici]